MRVMKPKMKRILGALSCSRPTAVKPSVPKVPKAIHQIWMDKNNEANPTPSIPSQFGEFMSAWKRMHPEYTYTLWTGDKMRAYVASHFPRLLGFYDALPTWIYRCDMFRYMLLERDGGIYIDADMQPVKHLSNLLAYLEPSADSPDGYTALLTYEKGCSYVTNAIIASCPGTRLWHDFLTSCVEDTVALGTERSVQKTMQDEFFFQNFTSKESNDVSIADTYFGMDTIVKSGCDDVLTTVGVYKLTDFLHEVLGRQKAACHGEGAKAYRVCVLENSNVLFPWSLAMTSTERLQAGLDPETVAIHHFASSWFSVPPKNYGPPKPPKPHKPPMSQKPPGRRDIPVAECGANTSSDLDTAAPAAAWMQPILSGKSRIIRTVEPRHLADCVFYQGDVYTSNATMVHDPSGGSLYVAVKHHNQKFPLGSTGKLLFWIALWELCPQTYEVRRVITYPPEPEGCPLHNVGRQDPRIYIDRRGPAGAISLLCNMHAPDGLFHVRIQELDAALRVARDYRPDFVRQPHLNATHQKNWCPFGHQGATRFVYNVHPEMAIGHLDASGNAVIEYCYDTREWLDEVLEFWCPEWAGETLNGSRPIMTMHGGTNLVHFPELGAYVGLMHIKNNKFARYAMVWYALQDAAPYRPIGCSRPFRMDTALGMRDEWDVIFCPGIERIRCAGSGTDKLVGSFSQNDQRMVMFELDMDALGTDWLRAAVAHYPFEAPCANVAASHVDLAFKQSTTQAIVLVGMPRSGTNYIMELFENAFGKDACIVLPEVLNVNKPLLGSLESIRARALTKLWRAPDKRNYVDAVMSLPEVTGKSLVLKVLSDQLGIADLAGMFVARPDTCIVAITRNPVHSFVSYKKAMKSDMWVMGDYSAEKVTFAEDEFKDYLNETVRYFRDLAAACAALGKPLAWIDYDDLFGCYQSHADRLAYVLHTISGVCALPATFVTDGKAVENAYVKQNKSSLDQDFENYADMLAYMEARGLLGLLDPETGHVEFKRLLNSLDLDSLYAPLAEVETL